jgi:palmitoyltransferase
MTKNNDLSKSKNMFSEETELKSNNILKPNDSILEVNPQNNNNSKLDTDNPIENKKFLNFKKIGNLIILYENEQGIKYVMGPLFPLSFLINLLANIFIIKVVYKNIPIIFSMIGTLINIAQIYFLIISSTMNPGLPLKEYNTLIYEEENKNAKNYRQCKDCKLWINTDEKTIHCRKCKICIEGYDHHCDCMNICIGKNNLKSFYIMILASFILILYSILITLSFK